MIFFKNITVKKWRQYFYPQRRTVKGFFGLESSIDGPRNNESNEPLYEGLVSNF